MGRKTAAKQLFEKDLIAIQNGAKRFEETFMVPSGMVQDPQSLKDYEGILDDLSVKNSWLKAAVLNCFAPVDAQPRKNLLVPIPFS